MSIASILQTWTTNLPKSSNIYDIKSSILTISFLSPSCYETRSKLFYAILDLCRRGHLQGNNLILESQLSKISLSLAQVNSNSSFNFLKLLKVFKRELDLLRTDLIKKCSGSFFWDKIEDALISLTVENGAIKSPKNQDTKKEGRTIITQENLVEKYILTLKKSDQYEIYEKAVFRIHEEHKQNNKQDLVRTAKIILKYVSLNKSKLSESLEDLCDKLITKEKDSFYGYIEDLKKEHPSANNLFTLCNNMNPYRETFLFDVLKPYLFHQNETSSGGGATQLTQSNTQDRLSPNSNYTPFNYASSVSSSNSSLNPKSNNFKIYYKYFRKTIEYGVGLQMFLMQNCGFYNEPKDHDQSNFATFPKRPRLDTVDTDQQLQPFDQISSTLTARSTNIPNFWSKIDTIRKCVGSLPVCKWIPETSKSGDLFSLYKNMIKIINSNSQNSQPPSIQLGKRQKNQNTNNSNSSSTSKNELIPNSGANLTKNSPESKQIFYTCLQIVIQASGAYCELVEPALIYGSEKAFRFAQKNQNLHLDDSDNAHTNAHTDAHDLDFDNRTNSSSDKSHSTDAREEKESELTELQSKASLSIHKTSIFPVKAETRAMLAKLNLIEPLAAEKSKNESSTLLENQSSNYGTPRSRSASGHSKSSTFSSTASSVNKYSKNYQHTYPPKKYNCTIDQLLFIFQQTEKILENEALCGSDWEQQMKKKWHVETMPFWVLTKSTIEFLNNEYKEAIVTLTNLEQNLRAKKFFGFSDFLEKCLVKRINVLKLLAGIELADYQLVEEAAQKLGSEEDDGCGPIIAEKSNVYAYSNNDFGHWSGMVNFSIGKDFINRSTFFSILYGPGHLDPKEAGTLPPSLSPIESTVSSNVSILDNENLFLIIGSQLFWENEVKDNNFIDDQRDDVKSNDPLKNRVNQILKQIEKSAIIEEEVADLESETITSERERERAPKFENETKFSPVSCVVQTSNFDFVKLLENVINLELLEKIHDSRLIWKESYKSKNEVYMKKKQKENNEKLKASQPKSKKSKRRQPQMTAGGIPNLVIFGKIVEGQNFNPKDEDAYNNALEEALLRCEEGDVEKNVAKIEAVLSRLASSRMKKELN